MLFVIPVNILFRVNNRKLISIKYYKNTMLFKKNMFGLLFHVAYERYVTSASNLYFKAEF